MDLTSALRDAERRLQAAQLAGDADVLDGLLDDRLIYTGGPDGARYSKQDDLEIQRSRIQRLLKVEEEELIVFVEGHTGVTWFLGTLEGTFGGAAFNARLNFTRTWIYKPDSGLARHSRARQSRPKLDVAGSPSAHPHPHHRDCQHGPSAMYTDDFTPSYWASSRSPERSVSTSRSITPFDAVGRPVLGRYTAAACEAFEARWVQSNRPCASSTSVPWGGGRRRRVLTRVLVLYGQASAT